MGSDIRCGIFRMFRAVLLLCLRLNSIATSGFYIQCRRTVWRRGRLLSVDDRNTSPSVNYIDIVADTTQLQGVAGAQKGAR